MSARDDRSRLTDTSGFTLIETLVAFAVMAMLLGVLFRGVVGLRAASAAFGDHTQEDLVARSVLEEALAKRDLHDGRYSGLKDGRRWTMVATPVSLSAQIPRPAPDPSNASQDAKPIWRPQRLIVTIETKGRSLAVETIRLVRAE